MRIVRTAIAAAALAVIASSAAAQPVLITAPLTLSPGDTTITPTAGGPPVPLETADITVRGTTLTVNGRFTIRSLLVEMAGVVTHAPAFSFDYSLGAGTDIVNGLWLNVVANPTGGDVSVTSGSFIRANGVGFAAGVGPGAGLGSGSATCAGGASHAGTGGPGQVGTAITYGNFREPTLHGSGGGTSLVQPGGSGGGVIRLVVDGTLNVAGSISASGATPVGFGGAGSGGSVYISAGNLAGTGAITANGAFGSSCANNGSGGGRVAIYADVLTHTGLRQAFGRSQGGPGTVFVAVTGETPQLHLDNVASPGTSVVLDRLEHPDGLDVFILGGATIDADVDATAPFITANSLTIDQNSTLTHRAGNTAGLLVAAGDVTIGATGAINVTGRGFGAGQGPGAGAGSGSASCAGGAGHGGTGGANGAATGQAYGSFQQPTLLGSGGGTSGLQVGGAGGGTVRLDVSGTLTVTGSVVANGNPPVGFGGAGSGGSVFITAATLAGTGPITANGNGGSSCGNNGGGGGRVAIYADTVTHTGVRQAFGRASAGPGTVYTVFGAHAELIFDNVGVPGTTVLAETVTLDKGSDVLIRGGTTLIVNAPSSDPVITADNVTIETASTLSHTPGNTNGLRVAARADLSVSSNSAINVSGAGFPAGSGPGAGGNSVSSSCAGGGSHGGTGGAGAVAASQVYGSFENPTLLGSGGGTSGLQVGTAGGGLISLVVDGTLTVSGVIAASGAQASGFSGAGSGGSVNITAGTLAGPGSILANGGTGSSCANNGGGGGRIAVHASTFTHTGLRQAFGRSTAGPGTVFLAVAGELPELRYDNVGVAGTTYLNSGIAHPDGLDLFILGGATIDANVDGTEPFILADSLTISGSTLTHRQGNPAGLHIVAGEMTIADSAVNVNARGFSAAQGPGAGGNSVSSSCAGGASHGGTGGPGAAVPGQVYGSFTQPTLLGSGGGTSGLQTGQPGGGAVRLDIAGTLTLSGGSITADGATALGFGGAGAGGSIFITATNVTGNPTISANGGTGNSCSSNGGGGGRIAVYTDSLAPAATITAHGRSLAGPGTVFTAVTGQRPLLRYENLTPGTTIVNEHIANAGGLDIAVLRNSTLVADVDGTAPFITADTLTIDTGSTLTHANANTAALWFDIAGDLFIGAGSAINSTARGFPAGQGPGAGTNSGVAICAGGAGHGGVGGAGAAGAGLVYGSLEQPTLLGSGGGTSGGQTGGPGGGAIRLDVDGILTVAGAISANGASAVGFSGAGSGGSVWITAADVAGAGVITANGGPGNSCSNNGGGGGRIAIHACTIGVPIANIRALKGTSNAGDGTVYINPGALAVRFAGEIPQCRGDSVTIIALSAGGTAFQWLRDGVDLADGPTGFGSVISGASTDTLTIANIQAGDRALYSVRALNACGLVTSAPVNLTLCIADFNCDGTVNSTDVSDFINQWFQDQVDGTFNTDWDGNGVVNSTDVSEFINDWFADVASGCG